MQKIWQIRILCTVTILMRTLFRSFLKRALFKNFPFGKWRSSYTNYQHCQSRFKALTILINKTRNQCTLSASFWIVIGYSLFQSKRKWEDMLYFSNMLISEPHNYTYIKLDNEQAFWFCSLHVSGWKCD